MDLDGRYFRGCRKRDLFGVSKKANPADSDERWRPAEEKDVEGALQQLRYCHLAPVMGDSVGFSLSIERRLAFYEAQDFFKVYCTSIRSSQMFFHI